MFVAPAKFFNCTTVAYTVFYNLNDRKGCSQFFPNESDAYTMGFNFTKAEGFPGIKELCTQDIHQEIKNQYRPKLQNLSDHEYKIFLDGLEQALSTSTNDQLHPF